MIDADALESYRRNMTAWQEWLARHCARYGATYVRLPTNWPIEKQIVPYLRARRLLA